MITREKALQTVSSALKETENRLSKRPSHVIYIHALEQLCIMREKLEMLPLPTETERNFVDIGIMAVKENLETSDPEYADLLMLADYEFRRAGL